MTSTAYSLGLRAGLHKSAETTIAATIETPDVVVVSQPATAAQAVEPVTGVTMAKAPTHDKPAKPPKAARSVRVVSAAYKGELTKKLVCKLGAYKIYAVNGDVVKLKHDMDFVEGGNFMRYKFIPKPEIWIDSNIQEHDWRFIMAHEVAETFLMHKHDYSYERAHEVANAIEKKLRGRAMPKSAAYKLGLRTGFALAVGGFAMFMKSAGAPMYTPEQLYNAIASVETGAYKNPWIRTLVRPKGGSTAYGPLQITATKLNDYAKRFKLFDPAEAAFIAKLNEQANLFKTHGGMKGKLPDYNPLYDYGGAGMFATDPKAQAMYRQIGTKMLNKDYALAGGDINKFTQLWRGVPAAKDPKYFGGVTKALTPAVTKPALNVASVPKPAGVKI